MTPGWWVYMVRCADGRLYCGASIDPERRVRQHNGEIVGGARFTSRRRPVELVYVHFIGDKRHALRVEWRLKRTSADWKHTLIQEAHEGPSLLDLSTIPISYRRKRRTRRLR